MQPSIGDTPALERALLRRSLSAVAGRAEHCDRCERALLIGERIYEYESGELRCSLCRDHHRDSGHDDPTSWRTVHTAAHGNSIRLLDRRPARRAA